MNFTVEIYPDEPIIIIALRETFNMKEDAAAVLQSIKQALDAASGPMIYINELQSLPLSFDDVMSGMALATQGAGAVLKHPNLRSIIVVTRDRLIEAGGKALSWSPYGGLDAHVVQTMDEALKLARQIIHEAA